MNMNENEKLPMRVKVCYGIGHLGNMLLLLMNAVFLLFFYTDVIGISARVATVIILIARVWDAFNDPMMGVIVDKKQHAGGKCRYFLKLFAVPAGICLALSYFVPSLSGSVKLIWVAVTYILQGMAQTAVSVPLFTMMARLSTNQVERAKLGQYQSFASIIANLAVPAVTLPFAKAVGSGNLQFGFSVVAIVYGIIFAVCFLVCWAGTAGYEHEPDIKEEQAPKVSVGEILKALFSNKVALLVALCYLMYCVYSTLMGSSLVYYLTYNLKNTDLMSAYSVLSTVTGFAPIFMMVVLVKKFGNAKTTMLACGVVVLGQLARLISHDSVIGCLYFGWCMEGVGVALFASMVRQCMLDAIVYGEWKTGVSNQAILMSILTFAQKLGQAVGGIGAAALLDFFGYVPDVETQAQSVLNVFFTENVTLPLLIFLLTIAVMCVIAGYEKQIPKMKAEIAKREMEMAE